jgi:hypothetical protein
MYVWLCTCMFVCVWYTRHSTNLRVSGKNKWSLFRSHKQVLPSDRAGTLRHGLLVVSSKHKGSQETFRKLQSKPSGLVYFSWVCFSSVCFRQALVQYASGKLQFGMLQACFSWVCLRSEDLLVQIFLLSNDSRLALTNTKNEKRTGRVLSKGVYNQRNINL